MSVTDTPIEPRAHVRGAHTASGDREPLSAASSLPGKGFDAQSKFVRSLTVYEARSFTPTKDPSTLVTAVIDREVMGPACGHSAVGSGQNHELSQHAASSGQRAGPKPPLAGGASLAVVSHHLTLQQPPPWSPAFRHPCPDPSSVLWLQGYPDPTSADVTQSPPMSSHNTKGKEYSSAPAEPATLPAV